MLVLETNGLTKKYKENYAVDHVNMHIEQGDIYGFVGENGAGKTTIIRLISGLAAPTSGDYNLFGVNSNSKEIAVVKSKMGGIVEAVSLNPSLTAYKNLDYQALLAGKTLTDEEKDNLLQKVGLNPKAIEKKRAGNFSLGMRQRLGIAMTLISDPEFIILDEPMNGLDPKGFIEVRDVIIDLNKKGVTFLISSHILSELDKICTRIGFISHGKLLKELTIEELHNQSKTRIEIEAEDITPIEKVLKEELGLEQLSIEGNRLYIFDDIDINKIIRLIASKDINVINLGRKEDTIETYYMKLMNGGANE